MTPTVLRLVTLLALAGAACRGPDAFTAGDRDAIRAASRGWLDAAVAAEFEKLAAIYSTDAVLLPPNGEPVVGRAAIQAFFLAFPPLESVRHEELEIEGCGDLAYHRGSYVMTRQIGEKSVDDRGKFLEVWRREPDGGWQLARDMFSSDLAR